jgi:hypothetical protein
MPPRIRADGHRRIRLPSRTYAGRLCSRVRQAEVVNYAPRVSDHHGGALVAPARTTRGILSIARSGACGSSEPIQCRVRGGDVSCSLHRHDGSSSGLRVFVHDASSCIWTLIDDGTR